MTDFHVGAGEISGEIYAGTLSSDGTRWRQRSIVTEEAVAAVRDHLISKIPIESKETPDVEYGYEWTRRDGKKVILLVKICEYRSDVKTDS